MSGGWIKLYRDLLNWEWYDDINTCRLFIHLLLTANHKQKKWRGYTILKGECITSQIHLSKETGLSVQNIRTSLNRLKSTGEITIKTTNKFSLIKIKNWDEFQEDNRQLTDNQQATNRQLTTNKNNKNNKNNTADAKASAYQEITIQIGKEKHKIKDL